MLTLGACGGGSNGSVQSTPDPISAPAPASAPAPTPSPTPTPTPASINYDTAEYRRSSGAAYHGAITAYEAGASGEGIIVGVVDSGISNASGEFTGRISPLSRDFSGNGSLTDIGGHGTAVSATLAAARNDNTVLGMAWGATVMALRTDKPGSCESTTGCEHLTSAMARAVDYAWRNGARIINISLGGDSATTDLLDAVSKATANGTIVVIAAGNAKDGAAPSASPDALARSLADPRISHGLVIIATSVDSSGTISAFADRAAGYERTTLSALGDSVRTVDHSGEEYYYTGTSFSAPQIAGAAALLAQAFPNLSSDDIVALLLQTAQDAGAIGADATYGMGVLDVANAFSPQGAISLAGSATPVAVAETSLLSAAMGDARPTAIGAVVLDSYERPYRVDLSGAFANRPTSGPLAAALLTPMRQLSAAAGPLSLAFNIAPASSLNAADPARIDALSLNQRDTMRAHFLSGTISAQLNPGASVALGLRTGAQSLETMLAGRVAPSFLAASERAGALASELRAASSLAWRQGIGRGLALTSAFETGTVAREHTLPYQVVNPVADRTAQYQALSMGLSLDRGSLGFDTSLRLLSESGSTLGARFAQTFGAQSARSLFAAVGARLAITPRLSVNSRYQRGWTRAASGGALVNGGGLDSRSWSLDIVRHDLLSDNDLVGLRIAAPLRVIGSQFALLLPDSWDWESATATNRLTPLSLVPEGSQRDLELSYARPFAGAWLGANLFMRREPGNIASAPDDYGAAVRWSLRF